MKELNDSDEMLTHPGQVPLPAPMDNERFDILYPPNVGTANECTDSEHDEDMLFPTGVEIKEGNEDE